MFDKTSVALMLTFLFTPIIAALFGVRWANDWKNPTGWDGWFSFVVILGITLGDLLVISAWVATKRDDYKRLIENDGARVSVMPTPKVNVYGNMKQADGFALTTVQVKINIEMLFARALIAQSRGNFDANLTEEFWIKSGRWNKLGGVGALDFRAMLSRWNNAQAIGRKNPNAKNSPYVITDRRKVARAADGEAL